MASFGTFSYTRGTPERDVPSRTVLGTSLKPTTKNKHLKETFPAAAVPILSLSKILVRYYLIR